MKNKKRKKRILWSIGILLVLALIGSIFYLLMFNKYNHDESFPEEEARYCRQISSGGNDPYCTELNCKNSGGNWFDATSCQCPEKSKWTIGFGCDAVNTAN